MSEGTVPGRASFLRAALAYREVRLLVGGSAVSTLGDWLYSVGFVVYVLDRTESPAWVAAAGIMRLAPHLLFGAFGGAIADRYDRRRVMIAADATRALLMLAMAQAAAAGAPAAVVIAIAFLTTTASTIYDPAATALLPAVVREEDLAAANTVLSIVENVALALGPALGGLLLALGEPHVAFLVNAATFGFAGLLVRTIRATSRAEEPEVGESLWRSAQHGARVMRASPDVALILAVCLVVSLLYGQETVLLVLAAEELLGMASEGAGFLYAAVGTGGLIGAGLTARAVRGRRPGTGLAAGVAISGLSFVGLALTSVPVLGIAVMTLDGIGAVLIDVLSVTMLQRLVARDLLGRAAGLVDVVSVAGGLAGAVLAPVLVETIGLRGALLAGGSILPALALLSLPKFREMNARATAAHEQVADVVEFFARLRIFDGATPQALELVAQRAEEVVVESGEHVVREGDPAESFYVVRTGDLDVHSGGESGGVPEKVNELGAGDYFGEIGLLRRIPRTATVTARTRSVLLRIAADDFAAIFASGPSVSGPIMSAAAGRLARTHPSYSSAS